MNRRMKKKHLKYASKMVLDELQKCSLFRGKYSAGNGNDVFMYGIWTVIECIASYVSEDELERANTEFIQNMDLSEEEAKNFTEGEK